MISSTLGPARRPGDGRCAARAVQILPLGFAANGLVAALSPPLRAIGTAAAGLIVCAALAVTVAAT